MAALLRQAGRIAESLGPMQRAVRLAPPCAAAQHDLGLTYSGMRPNRRGDRLFALRAVALADGFAHAQYRLGIALELKGASKRRLRPWSAWRRSRRRWPMPTAGWLFEEAHRLVVQNIVHPPPIEFGATRAKPPLVDATTPALAIGQHVEARR